MTRIKPTFYHGYDRIFRFFDPDWSNIPIRIELIWLKKSSNWSKSKIALRFDEKTLIRKDKKTINLLGCTRLCRLSSLGKITIWKKSGKIPLFPFYFSVLMWTMKIGFPQFPKLLRDSQISRNWRNDDWGNSSMMNEYHEKCAILLYSVCFKLLFQFVYTYRTFFVFQLHFPSFPNF